MIHIFPSIDIRLQRLLTFSTIRNLKKKSVGVGEHDRVHVAHNIFTKIQILKRLCFRMDCSLRNPSSTHTLNSNEKTETKLKKRHDRVVFSNENAFDLRSNAFHRAETIQTKNFPCDMKTRGKVRHLINPPVITKILHFMPVMRECLAYETLRFVLSSK